MVKRKIKRILNKDIEPDEIFLDSTNLSSLNIQQLEGWIEKPISKKAIIFTFVFFLVIMTIFGAKLWSLQISMGESFAERSERNSLKKIPSESERGVVYDRNGEMLIWNEKTGRTYSNKLGLHTVFGYLGYPTKQDIDAGLIDDPNRLVGRDGLEKKFDDILRGKDGVKIVEIDSFGNVQSENVYDPGARGENLILSLDSEISGKLYEIMRDLSSEKGFQGGAGVIMDIKNGELIALASFPEYNSNDLMSKDTKKISSYLGDKRMPFLDRVFSGLYLPGSVMKPIFALAALNEGIISPEKEIFSAGSISIPNPYSPNKPNVFKDWKAHGWVDMRRALAVSSDVYFYTIGGGYEDQRGLGIENIEKYSRMFGIGTSTGVELGPEGIGNIPTPFWKALNFSGEKWNIGNTYHSAIGQYGFQVTPIQIVRAIGAIASEGELVRPTVLKKTGDESIVVSVIDVSEDKFKVIKEGMRDAVLDGTSAGLNFSQVEVAAKTGTAELGVSKRYVNSWIVGFFPYDKPRYSFAVVMEKGPRENTVGGVFVMKELFNWMFENRPEYFE